MFLVSWKMSFDFILAPCMAKQERKRNEKESKKGEKKQRKKKGGREGVKKNKASTISN